MRPTSVTLREKGSIYSVEYATELLGAVSVLCRDQEAICGAGEPMCNESYREQILSDFSPWRGGRLTQMLEEFSDRYNFNYDAPVELVLRAKHGLPIDREALCLHRKSIPQKVFDTFLDEFRRFEQESDFAAFYGAHIDYYRSLLQSFREDHRKYDPLAYLTDFLNVLPGKQFHVNLMVGITNGNYAVTAGEELYANLCPYDRSRFPSMPDYSYDLIYWTTLIVHEFAHAFINPLTALYRESIREKDLSPYGERLKKLEYGDSLETYINETVIRAIECQYVSRYFPEHHDALLREYLEEGYDKLPQMEKLLVRGFEAQYAKILELF